MPALPLDEAGEYVAAAYLIFLALLLIYLAIMAVKLSRIDRELGELADLAEERNDRAGQGTGRRPDGADAGADQEALGVAEGKVFERERSSHREVSSDA